MKLLEAASTGEKFVTRCRCKCSTIVQPEKIAEELDEERHEVHSMNKCTEESHSRGLNLKETERGL